MTEQLSLRFTGKIFYKININNTRRQGQWTNKAGDLELGSRKPPRCWWWWFGHSVVSALCNPMDGSPPGSSVHGILQARVLEWFDFLLQGIFPTPNSPALQVDSLPTESPGNPMVLLDINTSVAETGQFTIGILGQEPGHLGNISVPTTAKNFKVLTTGNTTPVHTTVPC